MSTRRGNLVVLSAPSGTGKSTIVERLVAEMEGLQFSISATTRAPRSSESDGVEYHFLTRPDFERSVGAGGFLEHAEVHGNLYGTPRATTEKALDAGRDLLLDIDVQGAKQVASSGFPAVSIFVLPPSRAELERRLRDRATETEDALQQRMRNAAEELSLVGEFDHAVVNDDLGRAVTAIKSIVLAARHSARVMAPTVEALVAEFKAGAED